MRNAAPVIVRLEGLEALDFEHPAERGRVTVRSIGPDHLHGVHRAILGHEFQHMIPEFGQDLLARVGVDGKRVGCASRQQLEQLAHVPRRKNDGVFRQQGVDVLHEGSRVPGLERSAGRVPLKDLPAGQNAQNSQEDCSHGVPGEWRQA